MASLTRILSWNAKAQELQDDLEASYLGAGHTTRTSNCPPTGRKSPHSPTTHSSHCPPVQQISPDARPRSVPRSLYLRQAQHSRSEYGFYIDAVNSDRHLPLAPRGARPGDAPRKPVFRLGDLEGRAMPDQPPTSFLALQVQPVLIRGRAVSCGHVPRRLPIRRRLDAHSNPKERNEALKSPVRSYCGTYLERVAPLPSS